MRIQQALCCKLRHVFGGVGMLWFCHAHLAYSHDSDLTRKLTAIHAAEIDDLARRQQAQAKAITESVVNTPPTTLRTVGLSSNDVDKAIQTQKIQNAVVVNSVGANAINKARAALPRFSHLGEQLKYGTHVVVSAKGEEIVSLIRSLTRGQAPERDRTLRQLQALSQQGLPEAQHFLGFAFEYGLFGAAQDRHKAMQYYQAAAAVHYQPAIYNLALIAAYGRSGNKDDESARAMARRAYGLGFESSARVCGLASFLNYRAGFLDIAQKTAQHCMSPLAHFALASHETQTLHKRVSLLRDTLATGIDDAYALIARIAKQEMTTDNNYTFCKYLLVQRYRNKTVFPGLQEAAARCVDQTGRFSHSNANNRVLRDQVIAGVAAFVPTEISTLASMRQSNRFHYGWSVPYLPFGQQEVNLFEALMPKGKP